MTVHQPAATSGQVVTPGMMGETLTSGTPDLFTYEALPGVFAPEVDKRFVSPIDYFHYDNYCCELDGVSPVG
jgi:hypothetical protein